MLPFVFMFSPLYGAGNCSSIFGRGRDFFHTPPFPIRLFLLNVQGLHFLWGLRRPGYPRFPSFPPLKRWDTISIRSRFCVPNPFQFTVHQSYHSIRYRWSTDHVLNKKKFETYFSTPPLVEIKFWRMWRFAPMPPYAFMVLKSSEYFAFCCELVLAGSCSISNC